MATREQLSREEQLVAFFVSQCDGKIGRTQLMKYLYLADYEARRFLGRSVSDCKYVWYHYGPWDSALPQHISRLESLGVIREEAVTYPTGRVGYRYHAGEMGVPYAFTPDELQILAYVCETYSDLDLQTLLGDVVYETEPMLRAREADARNQPLDMSIVDGTKRNELGLPLEELLARSRRARAGQVVELAEVLRRLDQSPKHAAA